jgi:lysophospholipase L1-like esterase
MYREAKARGATVVALTLPPWAGFEKWYNPRRGASTEEVNRWIKEQHREGVVDLMLDVYPLMSCGDPTFLCPKYGWPDQVHWSAAGHEAVGRALHEHLFADCL